MTRTFERLTCLHCGAQVYRRDTPLGGRYRFSDRADGTDWLGSGSECPQHEQGHEISADLEDSSNPSSGTCHAHPDGKSPSQCGAE